MREVEKVQYYLVFLSSVAINLCITSVTADLVSKSLTKSESCHLQDRIDNGCAQVEPKAKSLVECTTLCRQNCLGIYWPDSLTCYHARPCSVSFPTCTTSDTKISFYSEKVVSCENYGVYNTSRNACQCVDGWVGDYCERLSKSCSELRDYEYPLDYPQGFLMVSLKIDNYPTPINVQCQVFGTYDHTVVMANTGQYSNMKTWSQYVNGFVYDDQNFFLGLEKMKAFNDVGLNELILEVKFLDGTAQSNHVHLFYHNFQMENSSSAFSFTFDSFDIYKMGPVASLLTIGDCLGPVEGGKFSTFDNDQDMIADENCAVTTSVGWWYKGSCNMVCNPLGRSYLVQPGPETPTHFKMDGIDFADDPYTQVQFYMYFKVE